MAAEEAALLRLEGASREFRSGELSVLALAEADLSIPRGELVCVLGPSGSGKSTLLNLIGGIDRPTSGRIWYGDQELSSLDDEALARFRRDRVGFIFQFYNLIPTLTAAENVQVAAELVPDPIPVDEALALVGLSERRTHFPSQLSGGEQQRVAIARALVKRPELILADEPTGALDLPTARQVLGVLQSLNEEQGITTLIITHNAAIGGMARRIVRVVSGRIAENRTNPEPIRADEVSW